MGQMHWPDHGRYKMHSSFIQIMLIWICLMSTCALSWFQKHGPSNVMSTLWHMGCTLLWCHNGSDGITNHQPHDCLLNCLFRHRSNKTSKLHVTGFCVGNSLETGEFPTQMASNAKNISISWCYHGGIVILWMSLYWKKLMYQFKFPWNVFPFESKSAVVQLMAWCQALMT